MPSPKQAKKYYYINNSKQRINIIIKNEDVGVTATVIVEHISTDSCGYTTAIHAVLCDYFKKVKIEDKLKRVTKNVLQTWETYLDAIYKTYLPEIQKQYPNTN